ncbi:hypothetical protein TNCV_2902821 [Trichonephila clavipes]|nr:hypothetical protein TNCV_2902821 [Trichonephila clavipes]
MRSKTQPKYKKIIQFVRLGLYVSLSVVRRVAWIPLTGMTIDWCSMDGADFTVAVCTVHSLLMQHIARGVENCAGSTSYGF